MIQRFSLIAMFICTVFVVALGCEEEDSPDKIIGEWESKDEVDGHTSTMEIEDDLEGEAKIWAYYGYDLYEFEFDVEVEIDEANSRYTMKMDSKDDGDLDFEMECELDGDDLECEGDELWENYDFEWERD